MPESFIAAIVFVVFAVIVLGLWKVLKKNDVRPGMTAAVLLLIAGLFVVNASFNTVPVRNVGIVTQFHTPTGGTTGSGVHWVRPWDKIEEWDANYELWDHTRDNADKNHPDGRGMLVKIAGNQDAWVPVSVEYAPNPENAPQDFKDYARNRDNWIARRVYPTLTNKVTTLFREHDPLAKSNISADGQINPPDMTPYKNQLNAELQASDLGFKIRNLYIGTIVYNDKTTEALQQYSNLVLQNRNLSQEKINQNLKNDITNNQAKVDKQTYCLQIAEKNNSNPGLCLMGSGSSVIVNSEPAK